MSRLVCIIVRRFRPETDEAADKATGRRQTHENGDETTRGGSLVVGRLTTELIVSGCFHRCSFNAARLGLSGWQRGCRARNEGFGPSGAAKREATSARSSHAELGDVYNEDADRRN